MSIATEISRIQQAKADIKSSIEAKGVTVPSAALIDDYSDYVDAIQTGGGGGTPIAKSVDVSDYTGGTSFNLLAQITDVNWPSGITSIGGSAFYHCTGLTSLTIPNSVTVINSSVFESCISLTTITIPSGVTSIGNRAFFDCRSLTSITIPSGVTGIYNACFYGCSALQSFTCLATTPPSSNSNNFLNDTNNCPIYVPAESVETYKNDSKWSTYASRIQAIPSE